MRFAPLHLRLATARTVGKLLRTTGGEFQLRHLCSDREIDPEDSQAFFKSMWESKPVQREVPHHTPQERQEEEDDDLSHDAEDADEENDDFGDDFDEFAEGGEVDDFGDFDEAEPETPTAPAHEPPDSNTSPTSSTLAGLVSRFPTSHLANPCAKPSVS